ncbi:MAG TPA: aminotransferase class V-fold PLP-dependent enzyme [Thermomicrobiales bacterium]|nr:aminotransferase class V-fold PLP-dependent enzyme [Thermomicrobiales bacterium]
MPDIKTVRDMLPGVSDTVYLNTGTCGPLPQLAYDEMSDELRLDLTKARISSDHFPRIMQSRNAVRAVVAAAIGADPAEIAVTSSTTDGMYSAILGYRWQAGDELLTTNIEHPGGLIPSFLAKRRFGVRVRVVDLGLGGGEPTDVVKAFERAITPRTRMIVLSHVSYTTGSKLPLKQIVGLAHAHDVLVVADAAQSYGALNLDVHDIGVDAYACSGQKWMCGPDGTGALYVRADRAGEFEQTFVSGGTIRESLDYYGASYAPAFGAARFDTAGRNVGLMRGQIAATRWINEDLGADWVSSRITEIAEHAYQELARLKNVTLVTPREALAGLIAFNVSGISGSDLAARMASEHNVTIRFVTKYINNPDAARVSLGFFNTKDDVSRLVDGIKTVQKTPGNG